MKESINLKLIGSLLLYRPKRKNKAGKDMEYPGNDIIMSGNYFSFAAIAFMILFLAFVHFNNGGFTTRTRKLLIITAYFALAGCVIEVIATSLNSNPNVSDDLIVIFYSLNMLGMFLSSMFFDRYTYAVIIPVRKNPGRSKFGVATDIITLAYIIALIVNYFTHYAFWHANEKLILKPAIYILAYVAPLFFLFVGLAAIFVKRRELKRREKIALISTHILVIFGALVQRLLDDRVLFVSFFITIGLYVIYTVLETPDYHRLLLTNRKLADAEKRANSANKAKSMFLSSMSHEIRTPMNAVLGMNELTRMTLDDDEMPVEEKLNTISTYTDNIHSSGEALLSIINDILDLSKIESGKMTIVEAPYHIKELMDEVKDIFTVLSKEKDLKFEMDIDESLPGYVSGDRIRVKQIVTNIVNNAVKYTEKGSIKVKMTGKRVDDVITYDIAVTDTGIGIKEENIDRIFESFDRIEVNATHYIEGTGLGLSIVKNLLELMDGSVDVESKYKQGSTFTVHIPQKVLSNESISDYRAAKTDVDGGRIEFEANGAKVLVVDDNKTNLKVAEGLLRRTGVSVKTADSGAEALEDIVKEKYSIIFLDHMMPNMDGEKVLNEIMTNPSDYKLNMNTPIVVMTANAMEGIKDRYIKDMGFTDYLAKPFKYSELIDILSKYLK